MDGQCCPESFQTGLCIFISQMKPPSARGRTVFIPQGLVVLGIFTIIGGITAFGRIFDAFTDPMIASWSDRCTVQKWTANSVPEMGVPASGTFHSVSVLVPD